MVARQQPKTAERQEAFHGVVIAVGSGDVVLGPKAELSLLNGDVHEFKLSTVPSPSNTSQAVLLPLGVGKIDQPPDLGSRKGAVAAPQLRNPRIG